MGGLLDVAPTDYRSDVARFEREASVAEMTTGDVVERGSRRVGVASRGLQKGKPLLQLGMKCHTNWIATLTSRLCETPCQRMFRHIIQGDL